MIDIKVPTVGESINEVTLVKWLKNDGDYVERDEVIAELESEKATFEVNAEQAGVLKTVGHEGDTLNIGDVLGKIDESAAKPMKSEPAVQKSGEKGNGMMNKEQGTKNKEQENEERKSETPCRRLFVAKVTSFLLGCYSRKQCRTPGIRVCRQCPDPHVSESRASQEARDLLVRKPEPHVAHLLLVFLTLMGEHVQ